MAVKFDPTVNLGHVLSAMAMLAAVIGSHVALDKRVVVLEEKAAVAVARSVEQQAEQKEAIREIRSDIKDVQRSLNDISRAMSMPHSLHRRQP